MIRLSSLGCIAVVLVCAPAIMETAVGRAEPPSMWRAIWSCEGRAACAVLGVLCLGSMLSMGACIVWWWDAHGILLIVALSLLLVGTIELQFMPLWVRRNAL